MSPRPLARLALALLALAAAAATARAAPCRDESFRGDAYIVCSFDLAVDDVRMRWRGDDGRPFRTFDAVAAGLAARGRALRFAMNGGMYDEDFRPVGLYVEDSRELVPVNTQTRSGRPEQIPNFYKTPNGVFFIGDGSAGARATAHFLAERPKVAFATQSGPMLVIDGAIHPAFIVNSRDRKPRNGVGVSAPTKVHFAISRGRVSFDAFARFFRDRLGCANALFLDGGSASGLYAPALGRNDAPGHGGYGPIITVESPAPR